VGALVGALRQVKTNMGACRRESPSYPKTPSYLKAS
jgi:hypothetical protein